MASAWPFLIARGRRRDYRTILAPDLLPGPAGPRRLADALPVGRPEDGQRRIAVEHAALGRLLVTARAEVLCPRDIGAADDDPVTDEHGRPLVHLYGLVTSADDPGVPDEADMSAARAQAMTVYQSFLADEPSFTVESSQSIEVAPAADPIPPAPPIVSVGAPSRPAQPSMPSAPHRRPMPSAAQQPLPSAAQQPLPAPMPEALPWPTPYPQQPMPPIRQPTSPGPGEHVERPDDPSRRWLLLVGALLGAVLAVLGVIHIIPDVPAIEDLQLVNSDPQRPCDNIRLSATFRLSAPSAVSFRLQGDQLSVVVPPLQLTEGKQNVALPEVIFLPSSETVQLHATTADGTDTVAAATVNCGGGPVHA